MSISDQKAETRDVVALNADVVGYSRLLADDFEGVTGVMDRYRRLVEDEISRSGGTLVNFVGDNFMAVFDDAMQAMQGAIAITTQIESENADLPAQRQVRFRMGIDQGPVAIAGGQYFGDALNVAARIQAIARPGGVSVSGQVYRALDEPALRFRSIGSHGLKNIPEEVEVYQFADLPTSGASDDRLGGLSLSEPRVAVLPIHTESVDAGLKSAAEMIREDLIHSLSKVPRLHAIDASIDSDQAGAKDTVRYVLETGVHQIGDQVRVYSKLMDAATWNIVTVNKWTGSADDLFALSEQVAEGTAHSLEIELIIGEPAGLYADLEDPDAMHSTYVGWYHLTASTPEGWAKALQHFGEVAETHPHQPYGHVLSAFANWLGVAQGMTTERDLHLNRALEQAQIGLDMGDPTGLAQMVVAAVLMFQGKPVEAAERVQNLVVQRPTCDATYAVEGSVRRYLGEWEKAVDLLDRAQRLTAVNNPWYPTVQACSFYLGGRVEQAAATAEAVLEFQPVNLEALLVLAAAQVELGLDRRARATADLIRKRFPSVDVDDWIEKNPYQRREMVDRWKGDLATAGIIE